MCETNLPGAAVSLRRSLLLCFESFMLRSCLSCFVEDALPELKSDDGKRRWCCDITVKHILCFRGLLRLVR